jgi:hypothetical protein
LAKVSDENSPDYILPTERIAAFDNDGTLGVEQAFFDKTWKPGDVEKVK